MEDKECFCNNCKRYVSALNFATHSAFCERNLFVCKICDEPVQISEKEKHLDEYHVISPCDLCKASLEKWMLPKHQELCPKRLVICEFCEADFPFDEHSEHLEFCGSRTEKCLVCQKYIMMKDKSKHTELHMVEKQLRVKNIEDEIKQNEVNEVICEKSTTEKISEKASETINNMPSSISEKRDASFFHKSRNMSGREGRNPEISAHGGAVASLPEKEISKHFTQCHICKETIRWIDFNTHVPNCASSAGKCSLCGEDVPGRLIKDHMKKHSQSRLENHSFKVPQSFNETPYRNDQSDIAKSNKVCDEVIKCPYCFQQCSVEQILEHTQSCSKNVYECPLCCDKIPEKDRKKHEKYECRMVQDNNEFNKPYFSSSQGFECPLCSKQVPEVDRDKHMTFQCEQLFRIGDTNSLYAVGDDSYKCPYCLEKMPQKSKDMHQSFFCKVLIENSGITPELPGIKPGNIPDSNSYAEITKKTCYSSSKSHQSFEICQTCKNKFSIEEISEHRNSCSRLKELCPFCREMMDSSCVPIHLSVCPSFAENINSADFKTRISQDSRSSNYRHKGAIPKNSNIEDMMKPRSAKCRYCNTPYNVDILPNHEKECIHMPINCKVCFRQITLKDLITHKCKRKKGKNQKTVQQTSEENNELGFWDRTKKFFSLPDDKGIAVQSKPINIQPTYSHDGHEYVSGGVGYNKNLYFDRTDDTLLPCEFCQKKFPASELVLHETGCQPHLVSYAKPDSSEKSDSMQNSMKKDSVPSSKSQNIHAAGGITHPFFAKSNLDGTSEHIESNRQSKEKAGEFLQHCYDKSSEERQNPKRRENNDVEKKCKPLNLQSVWNAENSTDFGTDDLKQILDNSDVDKTFETTNLDQKQKDLDQQTLEKHSHGDNDMRTMLKFLDEKSSESDEEYVSLSDENGEPENSEMKKNSSMNSENNIQEQEGDSPQSKKITNDLESKEVCQETLKSSDNTEKNSELYSRHFSDFKFDVHKIDFSSKDNVHSDIHSEAKYGELENKHKSKFSRCIERPHNQNEYVRSSGDLSDLKLGRYQSETFHDNYNMNEKIYEELEKHKATKFHDSDQRDYANYSKQLGYFNLVSYKSTAFPLEKNTYFPALPVKNYDVPENLHEQNIPRSSDSTKLHEQKFPKHGDSTKDVKENVGYFRHCSNFKYDTHISSVLSQEEIKHLRVLPEKHNKESKQLYNENNPKFIGGTEDNKDYIQNFRQHLPDFKFGSLETKGKSSEDNVSHPILPERSSHYTEQAFMLEPAGSLKEKNLPSHTVIKTDKKEVGLEEKIAALQRDKKILISAANVENDDVTKWSKWRNKVPFDTSGSG